MVVMLGEVMLGEGGGDARGGDAGARGGDGGGGGDVGAGDGDVGEGVMIGRWRCLGRRL